MAYRIALMPGDGIGSEISEATLEVLKTLQRFFQVALDVVPVEAGDACLQRTGVALPQESIDVIRESDACLKGTVGASAADVIVRLRQMLDLYANIRPVMSLPHVPCLRPDIDFVIVRENTEDLYRGFEFELGDTAVALRVITKKASMRIAEYAFKLAEERGGKRRVTAVHKENLLKKTCGLFAKTCREVAEKHKDVTFSEMLVDAAAMNLIREPQGFDILLTTNMFGDILSDEAAQLVGGLGMAPSGNIGDSFALFEPVHGSAPDIAGRGIANPFSMILSAKMMFEWLSMKHNDIACGGIAKALEDAVRKTLAKGIVTPDLGGSHSTSDVGRAVASEVVG